MRINKKTLFLLLFFTISSISIIPTLFSVSAISHPIKVKENERIRWDFEYNGSYEVEFSSVEWVEIEITGVRSDFISVNCSDSDNNTENLKCYPQDILQFLPLGSNSSFVDEPGIIEIVGGLAVISTNWKDHFEKWYSSTDIVTITNRLGVHHLHYDFHGKNRDVYIFNGTISQNHFYRDLIGEFEVIYDSNTGILLELFVDLNVGYITQNLSFLLTFSAEESTISLSPPSIVALAIIAGTTFGLQGLIILVLVVGVYIKYRMELKEKALDVVIKEESEEIDEKEEIKLEDIDYDYVFNCPYCNAELKPEDNVCPECGGKR